MNKAQVAALAAVTLAVQPIRAYEWSDTYLGYRHGSRFQEPTIEAPITKDVLAFTHADRYSLGSNFLNVDVFMSDRNDPANGAGSGGAQEIYVTYRHQLNFSKVFKTPLAFGPVRDLSFTAGFDLNSKDTAFAARKRALVLGPTVNFTIPDGFLDLGLWYYKEKNHNAFGVMKDVDFDGTLMISASWGIPVKLGSVASSFKGFANHTRAKGKDGALVETVPETLIRASWMVDVGSLLKLGHGALCLGPGYEYWDHKFGNPSPIPVLNSSTTRPNHRTSCPTIQLECHF
jgi:nucleoside-specific outer membrane channel protein Tsx